MHIQVKFLIHQQQHLLKKIFHLIIYLFIDLHDKLDLCASSKIFFNCWHFAISEKPSIVCAVQNFKYGNFDRSAIWAANAVLPLLGGPKIKFMFCYEIKNFLLDLQLKSIQVVSFHF